MIIFTVKNKMNGDIFVGTTGNDLDTQWNKICTAAELDLDYPLYRQIRCHGADQFLVEEWDCAENRRELNQLEQDAIDTLGAQSLRGYKTAVTKSKSRVSTRKVGNAKFQAMEKELAQMIFGDGDNEPGLFDDVEIPTPKGRLIKANELDDESDALLEDAEPSIADLKAASPAKATAKANTEAKAEAPVEQAEPTPAPKKKAEIKVVTKKRTRIIKNCAPTKPLASFAAAPAVESQDAEPQEVEPLQSPKSIAATPAPETVAEPIAPQTVAQPVAEIEPAVEPKEAPELAAEAPQEIIIPAARPWQKPKLELDDENLDDFLADVMNLMEPEVSDAEVLAEEPLLAADDSADQACTAAQANTEPCAPRELSTEELLQQRINAAIAAQREALANRTQADIDQQRAALAAQLSEFNQRAAELQSRSSCLH